MPSGARKEVSFFFFFFVSDDIAKRALLLLYAREPNRIIRYSRGAPCRPICETRERIATHSWQHIYIYTFSTRLLLQHFTRNFSEVRFSTHLVVLIARIYLSIDFCLSTFVFLAKNRSSSPVLCFSSSRVLVKKKNEHNCDLPVFRREQTQRVLYMHAVRARIGQSPPRANGLSDARIYIYICIYNDKNIRHGCTITT